MGLFASIFERRNDIGIREHFEALFKNTRDSVWAVEFTPGIPCKLDPDLQADKILHGQFIYANESMKKIFNLKSDSDIVGKTIQQFGVSLKPTFKQDQINFIKNGYEIIQCDEVKVHDTGEVRFIYCEIRGLIKNKKLTQMWAISRDITDEKKAEHHLHQLEKLQALGQMAGGIAHDFKNLITIIKGTAEIVEKDPSEIKKLSKVIETCSRADELCKRILIFSKNKKSIPESLDLNHEIKEFIHLSQDTLLKGFKINLNLGAGPIKVFADPVHLGQIFLNIIVNAVEASTKVKEITISSSFDDSDSFFSFSDKGDGISETDLKQVFEPYFTTKGVKGSGLGLSTVFNNVTEMNGKIKIESKVNEGTTFHFHFKNHS